MDWWLLILTTLLSAIIAISISIYFFFLIRYRYWKDKNVPFHAPSFPMGTFAFKKNVGVLMDDIYKETKHERYLGSFMMYKPQLIIYDLDLVKKIFVSDFMSFHDRGVHINEEEDPLTASLPHLAGAEWRNVRVRLTPTFTSGKMKMMFPTLLKTSRVLQNYLKKSGDVGEVVEVKDITARFTTDVIASCAFGLDVNSIEDPKSEFREMGKLAVTMTSFDLIKMVFSVLLPEISRIFKMRLTKKRVEEFFLRVVKETIEYRESNNIKRNDFLQMMIELINKGYLEDVDSQRKTAGEENTEGQQYKFTIKQAAAQAFVFFGAGFDTSSTTIQFALFELARNQEIQKKTLDEIDQVLKKHNNELSYEATMEMQYVDKVVSETLRKYPVLPVIGRACTKPYKIPDSDLVIEEGVVVQVPVYSFQHDPRYYPDPEKFDPERFNEEEKAKRPAYTYFPFGEGPRQCIGNRFALMQVKVGLISLLSKFKFDICEETPKEVVFDPTSILLTPMGGMHLKISTRVVT